MNSKILAIDWGLKRVGLAVGEPGFVPQTLPPLVGLTREKLIGKIANIYKEFGANMVLLGLPTHIGNAGKVKRIGQLLVEAGLEVEYLDETLTSHQARRRLRDLGYKTKSIKKMLDSESAALMLEEYLRSDL